MNDIALHFHANENRINNGKQKIFFQEDILT